MKTVLRRIGVCALLILVAGTVVVAKDWRGITLLKSTRQDVERLLGRPTRSAEGVAYYTLPKEIVVFRLETRACSTGLGICGWRWNVPLGTVIGIGVIPRGKHRKEEYISTNNSKVDDRGAGFVLHSDDSGDLAVETYQNLVTMIDYYPGATHNNLLCPKIEECIADPLWRFDEYPTLSFQDQKARLDNFLIAMNKDFLRGIIQVIGPNEKARQKLMESAARGKRYLVKQRGLEEERLLIVDGGFGEEALTRLSIHAIGGPGSRVYLFPEKDR